MQLVKTTRMVLSIVLITQSAVERLMGKIWFRFSNFLFSQPQYVLAISSVVRHIAVGAGDLDSVTNGSPPLRRIFVALLPRR